MDDVEGMYVQHAVVKLAHEPTVNISGSKIMRRHVFNRASRRGHRGVDAYISSSSRLLMLELRLSLLDELRDAANEGRYNGSTPMRLHSPACLRRGLVACRHSATPTTRAQETHPTKERVFVAFWEATRRKHEKKKGNVAETIDLPPSI